MTISNRYLAITLVILSGIYALLATYWTHIFNREVLRHAVRGEHGYRIGLVVYRRLPLRGALLVIGVGALGVILQHILSDEAALWVLGLEFAAMTALWLCAPPGLTFYHVADEEASDRLRMRIVPLRNPLRALFLFLALGLMPSAITGLVVYKCLG